MNISSLSLAVLILHLSATASARTAELDARSLFKRSSWVIEATVKRMTDKPVLYDEFGALGAASVTLNQKIYGEPYKIGGDHETLEFLTRPDMGEGPTLVVGERYVFFWRGPPPFIVADHYDVREIDSSGCVDTRLILGLSNFTSVQALAELADFYGKLEDDNIDKDSIEEILAKNSCKESRTDDKGPTVPE